jgi:hypothetical protein
MKLYLSILLFFFLSSCLNIRIRDSISEFILFGYPGFYLYDSCDNYYLDSTRLDVRLYIDIKIDNQATIIKHKYREENKYFSLTLLESQKLLDSINSLLGNVQYDSEYCFLQGSLYDGWSYTIYYRTLDNKEFTINYIPELLPGNLRKIHDLLIKYTIESSESSHELQYNAIVPRTAIFLYKRYPPPPPARQKVIYKPPVIKDTTKIK